MKTFTLLTTVIAFLATQTYAEDSIKLTAILQKQAKEQKRHDDALAAIQKDNADLESKWSQFGLKKMSMMEHLCALDKLAQRKLDEEQRHHDAFIENETDRHDQILKEEQDKHNEIVKTEQDKNNGIVKTEDFGYEEVVNKAESKLNGVKALLDKFNLPGYDEDANIVFPGQYQGSNQFRVGPNYNLADDFTDAWSYRHYVTDSWAGYPLKRVEDNLWQGSNKTEFDWVHNAPISSACSRTHTVSIRITQDGKSLECKFQSIPGLMDEEYQMSWDKQEADPKGEAQWLPLVSQEADGTWVTGTAYILNQHKTTDSPYTKAGVYQMQITK